MCLLALSKRCSCKWKLRSETSPTVFLTLESVTRSTAGVCEDPQAPFQTQHDAVPLRVVTEQPSPLGLCVSHTGVQSQCALGLWKEAQVTMERPRPTLSCQEPFIPLSCIPVVVCQVRSISTLPPNQATLAYSWTPVSSYSPIGSSQRAPLKTQSSALCALHTASGGFR